MIQKLVVISDIHVHPWSAFAKGTGATNTRLRATLDVIRESLAHAEKIGAPWLCAGDIVHTAGHTKNVCLNLIIESLNEYPSVQKIMIWGNHDSRGKGRARVTIDEAVPSAIAKAVVNAKLLDQDTVTLDSGLTIYGEGAQPKRAHYGWPEISDGSFDVGLFHFTVHETCSPSGFSFESDTEARELLSRFPLTIVGDIHHPQDVFWEDEGRLLLVPGAPEHHNFGDKGERGFWEVEMEEDSVGQWKVLTRQMHPSSSPKFLTVDTVEEVIDAINFYRIRGAVNRADIPKNATVVGSGPTTVKQRRLFEEGATVEEILTAWMREVGNTANIQPDAMLEAGMEFLDEQELGIMKQVLVKRIKATDFFSYEELDFTPQDGVTLVVGESRDYTSNGAGKSTIFEALYWCLFGKTTKGVAAGDEVRRGKKSCVVTTYLEIDGDEVKVVRRRRGRKVEFDVWVGPEPLKGASAGEVTSELCSYMGIDESIFRALAYYSQEEVLLFSRITDGDRKSLLAQLCGLEAYENAADVARQAARVHASDLERANMRSDTARRREADLSLSYNDKQEQVNEWAREHTIVVDAVKERLDLLRPEQIAKRGERLTTLWEQREDDRLQALAKEYGKAARIGIMERRARAEKDMQKFKYEDMLKGDATEIMHDWRFKLQAAAKRQNETDLTMGTETRQVEVLHGKMRDYGITIRQHKGTGEGDTCQLCGQVLAVSHVEKIISEQSDALMELKRLHDGAVGRLEEAREEFLAANSDADTCQSRVSAFTNYLEAKQRRDEAQSELENLVEEAELEAGITVGRAKTLHGRRLGRLVSRAKTYMEGIKETIGRLEKTQNPYEDALSTLGLEMEEAREETMNMFDKKGELRMVLDIAEYWAKGFSKQGIQSLLLEEVAAEFNRLRSDIFPLLTHGTIDVQFSTTAATRKGELREKTEFLVTLNGEDVPYETLSGGQRRRVDLGVMLTLAAANAATRGVPGVLGVLIFDEVFDYLDSDGAEGLLEALQEVAKIIPSIYVITQDNEMKSLFPQVLEVVQDDSGISRVA